MQMALLQEQIESRTQGTTRTGSEEKEMAGTKFNHNYVHEMVSYAIIARFFAQCGVLQVAKGITVVMTCQKLGNLYRMVGNTITSEVTVTTSAESNTDSATLWHLRLGHISERDHIFLTLYVDDMLIATKSKSEIAQLKALLSAEFEMKDLGTAKKILDMEVSRDRQS
ncbi:hypothetical protein RJ639_020036 [Escallonia herrerae]|uniref:Reverse transcriptase Ty1/copia-type domain-containing protein n=1 Tax=Escallonia herrerae TaxID=1293975 RepID=A0AA88V8Y8_9ASTE|nr:hypothetical protein RJ639_020036 [Escallonia herrerae]